MTLPCQRITKPSSGLDDITKVKQQDRLIIRPIASFGRRWRRARGAASHCRMKSFGAALVIVAAAAGAAGPRGTVVFAGGSWAAIDRGAACEALVRSAKIASKGKVQAVAGFSFTPDRRRWGEFHARLSRTARPGSSVMLTVGSEPFLLVARGNDAWSRGPLQEQAIIAAVRDSGGMKVEARDLGGSRFVDPYSLDGAPTAIDAAAARCAGKKQ